MTAGIIRIGDRRTFFGQLPLVIAGPTIGDRRTFFVESKQSHGFPKPFTDRPVSADKGTLQSVICFKQRGERAIARLLIEKLKRQTADRSRPDQMPSLSNIRPGTTTELPDCCQSAASHHTPQFRLLDSRLRRG
jgi:hypothetical protein